jgi:hypothetical protein
VGTPLVMVALLKLNRVDQLTELFSKGRLLALLKNIRLEWKGQ